LSHWAGSREEKEGKRSLIGEEKERGGKKKGKKDSFSVRTIVFGIPIGRALEIGARKKWGEGGIYIA